MAIFERYFLFDHIELTLQRGLFSLSKPSVAVSHVRPGNRTLDRLLEQYEVIQWLLDKVLMNFDALETLVNRSLALVLVSVPSQRSRRVLVTHSENQFHQL